MDFSSDPSHRLIESTATRQAMQALGGWGYATGYDVERWWREINLTGLAPVTQQMAHSHIGQELGFPRSY